MSTAPTTTHRLDPAKRPEIAILPSSSTLIVGTLGIENCDRQAMSDLRDALIAELGFPKQDFVETVLSKGAIAGFHWTLGVVLNEQGEEEEVDYHPELNIGFTADRRERAEQALAAVMERSK